MMKKTMLIVTSLLMMSLYGQTQSESNENDKQTYQVSVNKGKILINLGKATIEGYDGKEIVFSKDNSSKSVDERAKGLRAVNAMGLEDNTGLGINVIEKSGTVEVNQLKRISPPNIKILVPKNMLVSFNHQSQYGGTVTFKNIESEIDASTTYNNMVFENVTGPTTISSVYGSIDAKFSTNIKSPLSVVSIYGNVDVSLPKTAKANVKVTTNYGEILVAPELPLKIEKKLSEEMFNDQLNATLNGGGNTYNFRSDYGKVYLRAL